MEITDKHIEYKIGNIKHRTEIISGNVEYYNNHFQQWTFLELYTITSTHKHLYEAEALRKRILRLRKYQSGK